MGLFDRFRKNKEEQKRTEAERTPSQASVQKPEPAPVKQSEPELVKQSEPVPVQKPEPVPEPETVQRCVTKAGQLHELYLTACAALEKLQDEKIRKPDGTLHFTAEALRETPEERRLNLKKKSLESELKKAFCALGQAGCSEELELYAGYYQKISAVGPFLKNRDVFKKIGEYAAEQLEILREREEKQKIKEEKTAADTVLLGLQAYEGGIRMEKTDDAKPESSALNEAPADAEAEEDIGGSSDSISVSMNKGSVLEDSVLSDTPLVKAEEKADSISNEAITKGISILNTYEVVSDAIKGGMGSVWKVHHNSWNTDLAMKRPQPKFFAEGSEKRKENFIRECESWINLGLHPNIVSCYYVREISGVPTIFSEWMENGSLENKIRDGALYKGTEEEQQARLLDIAIQFARGLHYAHESQGGLIHQDVKPDNLLLTDSYDAKVADFGLAQARVQMEEASGGETGAADGDAYETDAGATHMAPTGGYTPAYCSGEQLKGETLTRRTDIYSWAVSVLEMYLGERPWKSGVEAGKNCETWFGRCRVAMPEALSHLLTNCLKRDPAERPHDFAVVTDELKKIYRDTAGEDYPRPEPEAAADTADSLNNRALSFLDLGREEDAENYWKKALEKTPEHLSSIYNQGLYLWRQGKIDDEEVLRRCAASRQSEGSAGLAGKWYEQISRERGVHEKEPFGESTVLHKWEGVAYKSSPSAALDSVNGRLFLAGSRECTPDEEEIRNKFIRFYSCVRTEDWQTLYTIETGSQRGIGLLEDNETIFYMSPDKKIMYLAEAENGNVICSRQFEKEVMGIHMHPDGEHVFISIGKTLQKWDRELKNMVKKWDADADPRAKGEGVYTGGHQRFSEDGRYFYQGDRRYFLEWDTETLELTRIEPILTGGWLLRNGKGIYASGISYGEIVLYTPGLFFSIDTAGKPFLDGKTIFKGDGSSKEVFWVNGDETRMLAGNKQGRLKLYDLENRRILCTWFGQTQMISSAAASPDLSYVVSCCADGDVRVFRGPEEPIPAQWELSKAVSLATVQKKQKESEELASRIEEFIEAGDLEQAEDTLFKAEELEGSESSSAVRKLRRRLTRLSRPETTEAISEESLILTGWSNGLDHALSVAPDPLTGGFAVGGFDCRNILRFGEDYVQSEKLEFPYEGWSGYYLRYSPSGRYLIAGLSGMVRIWDRELGDRQRTIKDIQNVHGEGNPFAVSPDERKLLVTGDKGFAVLYDLKNPVWKMPLKAGEKYLCNGCFSPDGKLIYLLGWDEDGWDPAIRIYDTDTFECIRIVVLEDETSPFRIALEPEGKRLFISFGNRDRIMIMDTETYELSEGFDPGQGRNVFMSFDPSGRLMATASMEREGSIKLWKLPGLELLETLQPSEKEIKDLAFSADGCVLFACVGSNVQTWDIRWKLEF